VKPEVRAVLGHFNSWRRKYWRTRVLILLLVYSPFVVPYLCKQSIVEINVRIANDAIVEMKVRPAVVTATAEFFRFRETRQLQQLIRQYLDTNKDGVVDQSECESGAVVGLAPEQINTRGHDADLRPILLAAQRLGVASPLVSTASINRQALYAAMGETELLIGPQKAMADADFASYYDWPEYSKWATWRNGLTLFGKIPVYVFTLGSPLQMLLVAIAWLGASGLAIRLPQNRRRMVGMLLTVAVTAALVASADRVRYIPTVGGEAQQVMMIGHAFLMVGFTCLGMVIGALGVRLWGRLPWPGVVPVACCLCLGCAAWLLSETPAADQIYFDEIHLWGDLPPLWFSNADYLAIIAFSAAAILASWLLLRHGKIKTVKHNEQVHRSA